MKPIDLCGTCSEKMKAGYKLKQLPRPSNNKIFCGLCQRRRYGATYEVTKRDKI